jgi:hypothetical protein
MFVQSVSPFPGKPFVLRYCNIQQKKYWIKQRYNNIVVFQVICAANSKQSLYRIRPLQRQVSKKVSVYSSLVSSNQHNHNNNNLRFSLGNS